MGVIQRQGIKDSVVTYVGVALGAINTLFIYTNLPDNILGLSSFLVSIATLVVPFTLLSSNNLALRFFPDFRDEPKKHNGFLFFLLVIAIVGWSLFTLILLLFEQPILNATKGEETDPLVSQFFLYLIPLVFFITFNQLLIHYARNFLRIVIPTVLENVWIKFATGFISLLFLYAIVDVVGYIVGIIIAYGVVMLGMVVYLRWLGQLHLRPNFSLLQPPLLRSMSTFALYSILGGLSGLLMVSIDKAMITFLLPDGLGKTGIFSVLAFIGATIDTPRKSLERIATPIVSDAIQREDWAQVSDLYKRTSINLLVFGMLLLLGIWLNIDRLFDIMPQKNVDAYRAAKYVVLLFGISSIVDMVTSINTQIISFSRHFRFNFYLVLILAGLNVILTYLFIGTFDLGILGAALATLTSIAIFNMVKFLFILQKFRLQPFSMATLWVLVISAVVYGVVLLLPDLKNAILDILYKSILITLLYLAPILYFKLSPDINQLVERFLKKYFKK